MLEFQDVPIGDIFVEGSDYFRKISDTEVVELVDNPRVERGLFLCGEPGEVHSCFDAEDEVDTVPDDKKRELLAAHKVFLEDLANLWGVIL